jgi:hypothetical protein
MFLYAKGSVTREQLPATTTAMMNCDPLKSMFESIAIRLDTIITVYEAPQMPHWRRRKRGVSLLTLACLCVSSPQMNLYSFELMMKNREKFIRGKEFKQTYNSDVDNDADDDAVNVT